MRISTHALREEGDSPGPTRAPCENIFLPTPSARRATDDGTLTWQGSQISTHALREEGDRYCQGVLRGVGDFYPRPPRGGRRTPPAGQALSEEFLPTPSARRATPSGTTCMIGWWRFLPTPSARRATFVSAAACNYSRFLPTPSARRATTARPQGRGQSTISTHALREEGDPAGRRSPSGPGQFLPTPSARRATAVTSCLPMLSQLFLPTPSARRATDYMCKASPTWVISTHALREEGDMQTVSQWATTSYFYPRPPRGGRPRGPSFTSPLEVFLPTPSARRATPSAPPH